jgi:hypothetical protein
VDFTSLIAQADSLEALRPLLRALGFARPWIELAAEHWPEPLRSPANEWIERCVLGGRRGSLQAFVLQLPRLTTATASRVARRLRDYNPAGLGFYVFVDVSCQVIALGAFGAAEDLRLLFIERDNVRATDLDALRELAPRPGERGLVLALRQASVLDRSRVTQRFFLDFKAQRTLIAEAWRGVPRAALDDRRQLALLFLCRLMFLYFLQRRGHLGGDRDYLYTMWRSWAARRHTSSFYRARIKPLFFGVLNRRPERRSAAARRLGDLPYLNGGLFDRHALERRHRSLDLPDRVIRSAFDDLLQRYRFTTQDAAEHAAARTIDFGIDPEMLGRVFEELMAEAQRGDTGTYFTPPEVVDRLVLRALHTLTSTRGNAPAALRDLRVLDPACGSGAFLLGALNRIAEARALFEGRDPEPLRREIVQRSLHGVDLQSDAALLCALRLWLSLLPATPNPSPFPAPTPSPSPLPNLDRNVRQGDALIDPIDLAAASLESRDLSWSVARNAGVRAAVRALKPASARYVTCDPEERVALQRELLQSEARLGRAWIEALQAALDHVERELRAASADLDLFGAATRQALDAQRAHAALAPRKYKLNELRTALLEKKALPFFSFDVHFAHAAGSGFDLIVSNPPWVRAHRWPESVGRVVRERYEVCRAAAWQQTSSGGVPAAQVDLALLFLERALRLLAPHGTLAMLLPAKSFRSLYAGSARALVLRETRIKYIEDHSLDQRSIFRADAFAGALVVTRQEPDPAAPVHVSCYQRKVPPLQFDLPHHALSLEPDQPASPWLLVPPDVAAALRAMQACGAPIRARPELLIHRGVFTGANEVLLVDDVRLKLGDHAWIRSEGFTHTPAGKRRAAYRALIEESALRPVVSGRDLRAWSYRTEQAILWSHDANTHPQHLPPRATRYLARHARRLQQRSGWKAGQPLGTLFRVAPHTVQPKLAWRDLAPTLEAVVLPAQTRQWGRERELIPLNTVYYISPPNERCARLLCAYFNSLSVRTFVRAIAERAKDAHFRFFAWVIAQVPLPAAWQRDGRSDPLSALASHALERASIDAEQQSQLDELVADAYALTRAQRAALAQYDAWLGAAHT